MLELAQRLPEIEQAGAQRIVCVLKENLPEEVESFKADVWPREVYLDETKAFYEALGGGTVHKPYGVASFLAMLANPFSSSPTKRHLAWSKKKGVKNNMTGEGFIQGGSYVVRQDGEAELAFLEQNLGDHASPDDIIAAVGSASAMGKTSSAAAMGQ